LGGESRLSSLMRRRVSEAQGRHREVGLKEAWSKAAGRAWRVLAKIRRDSKKTTRCASPPALSNSRQITSSRRRSITGSSRAAVAPEGRQTHRCANAKDEPRWVEPKPAKWDYTLFGRQGGSAAQPDETIQMLIAKQNGADHGFNRRMLNG